MAKTYLWQAPDFPHFYSNPAIAEPLERAFRQAVDQLDSMLSQQVLGFDDVLTEEIVANSEIEGVLLDRESVHSSFVQNITPPREKEQGAVQLTRMALNHYRQPLSHELLYTMHREILKGSTGFPEASIGVYVGNMKIVSGSRIDREYKVLHEGVSQELVYDKMTEFIEWYNQCSSNTPFVNAIQGHVHFETLHPFCDGNGRIGRNLMLMGLCRDLGRNTPLALSRSFNRDLESYYRQFEAGLDLTKTIQFMSPLFLNAVRETGRILELTAYRTKVADQADGLNPRQLKVLNRLIDYELRGGFEGGMNNAKYQKMATIGDRTALRDLGELEERALMVKVGKLKGTRYYLNIPHLIDCL
jgi:Fic family protein